MTSASAEQNRRKWLIIIALAVVAHLFVLLTVQDSFFEVFQKSVDDHPGSSSSRASNPQAIIAIQIDVEGDEPSIIEIEETPRPPTPDVPPSESQGKGLDEFATVDLDNLVGESQSPLPSESSGRSTAVPPRPIEITWPDTDDLGHCLGRYIDIRILVGIDGQVIAVKPTSELHPPDCAQAAVDAARRIRFLPGKIKGKAAEMWTQIRIDFRRKG